jgi:hypothetical protein
VPRLIIQLNTYVVIPYSLLSSVFLIGARNVGLFLVTADIASHLSVG